MPPCTCFIPYPFGTTIEDIEFSIPCGKIAPFLPRNSNLVYIRLGCGPLPYSI